MKDIASPDSGARLRTAQMLKEAAYPEAAVPLAALITDPKDDVQLEAIAAELNIFLAEKVVPRKRLGYVIEVRNAVNAEAAFSMGPLALGARPVPREVLDALRAAIRDDNPRVGVEALYAFGALAVQPVGAARRELLRVAGPDLAALVGAPDPAIRFGAVRVLGRLFAPRPGDDSVAEQVGDAVIVAVNDKDNAIKGTAMVGLGTMRYDRAVQALTDLYQYYGKGDLAMAALDGLARIANAASAPLFVSLLSSKTPAVRGIAVEGLARIGDASKLADIEAVTKSDKADGVQLAAAFAATMLSRASIDRLMEAAGRPNARDRARAYLAEAAPGRTALFTRALQDPDARIRTDAADALGVGGDSAALPLLDPVTKDPDAQVARAAQRAVARLR
jgi:HEAT repeat protein